MSNCDDRENEKRDLVPRLLPLSHDDFNDVMFCGMLISSADDWDEALRLLDKYPLSYVHRFLSVQKDQAKARSDAEKPAATPDDDTATVVDVAFDTLEVEVSKLSTEDCAKRLEAFLWEVSRDMQANDNFTISGEWTAKGLRRFLAEREFLQSLLPEE